MLRGSQILSDVTEPDRAPAPRHHRPRPLAGGPAGGVDVAVDDIGETAYAIRRETRVIDEHADALLDLVADIEAWYDGPEPDACRNRIAMIHARTAAIRQRIHRP